TAAAPASSAGAGVDRAPADRRARGRGPVRGAGDAADARGAGPHLGEIASGGRRQAPARDDGLGPAVVSRSRRTLPPAAGSAGARPPGAAAPAPRRAAAYCAARLLD